MTVNGDVSVPATYSLAQLEALPQTTVQLGGHALTGVSLETLVTLAKPVLPLPPVKNALLRVTITVVGSSGRAVTFALGELVAGLGNHPALLVLRDDGVQLRRGPDLVVPGDTVLGARYIRRVRLITVSVHNLTPTPPPSPGAITVHAGSRTIVLTASQLAALPSQTVTFTFIGPTGPQAHTETGPTLDTVLAALRLRPRFVGWVAAVAGFDGYEAIVTPLEAEVGGRPLLISLIEDGRPLPQPRLIVVGDIHGARQVSGVTDLYIGQARPFWVNLLDELGLGR